MAVSGVTSACVKIGNIAQVINELTSDKGEVEVNNRMIDYEVRGHFYRWKFIWDCQATDRETGISVKPKAHKSREGALKHGITDLMDRLAAEGKI